MCSPTDARSVAAMRLPLTICLTAASAAVLATSSPAFAADAVYGGTDGQGDPILVRAAPPPPPPPRGPRPGRPRGKGPPHRRQAPPPPQDDALAGRARACRLLGWPRLPGRCHPAARRSHARLSARPGRAADREERQG